MTVVTQTLVQTVTVRRGRLTLLPAQATVRTEQGDAFDRGRQGQTYESNAALEPLERVVLSELGFMPHRTLW